LFISGVTLMDPAETTVVTACVSSTCFFGFLDGKG